MNLPIAVCAAAGSPEQPLEGLRECEADPLATPPSQMTFVSVVPDVYGVRWQTTRELSVVVMFCSDWETLTGPPWMCM